MAVRMYDMSSDEIHLFAKIVGLLSERRAGFDLRGIVFPEIMKLLRADVLGSFIWDRRTGVYGEPFVLNQDPENVARYQTWFQFRDPITQKMRELRRVAHVDEVISRHDLRKTEFYNDFLARDGMHTGINLFCDINGGELADLRIWRSSTRPEFTDREINLLTVLAPYLWRGLSTTVEVGLEHLTDRERDVALLVGRGCSDKEIARILDIGFATVRTHLGNSLAKLECSNRTELAALVARLSH